MLPHLKTRQEKGEGREKDKDEIGCFLGLRKGRALIINF